MLPPSSPPLIGITADNRENRAASGHYELARAYCRAVSAAGGLPAILPHEPALARAWIRRLDGLVLTGGVDPDTRPFGHPLHPAARPMDPTRQTFELALLESAAARDLPTLGICLGMQLMALLAGGRLDQFLPDHLPSAPDHAGNRRHPVRPVARPAPPWLPQTREVVSAHRQAVADPGNLRRLAEAPDGVLEAIDEPTRRFWVGVQWHPERAEPFNPEIFEALVQAARGATSPRAPDPPPP